MTFRIIPKQTLEIGSGYALVIRNHPRGIDAVTDGQFYRQGDYIAKWKTWEEAVTAAYCLDVGLHEIQPCAVIYPEPI